MHQMRSWFCTFFWWWGWNGYAKDQLRTLTTHASSATNTRAAAHRERIAIGEGTLSARSSRPTEHPLSKARAVFSRSQRTTLGWVYTMLLNTMEEAIRIDNFNIAAIYASRYHLLKANINSCDVQSKSGFNVHTQLSKAAGDVSKYIRKFNQEKSVYYGISLLVI